MCLPGPIGYPLGSEQTRCDRAIGAALGLGIERAQRQRQTLSAFGQDCRESTLPFVLIRLTIASFAMFESKVRSRLRSHHGTPHESRR
jgi:hypothetical protein